MEANKKIEPRIISGKYKNRKLSVPNSARPMTDRIKRSIFDIISSDVEDTQVLDLFAGSGNLAIEALSRGAQTATFIEKDFEAKRLIEENIERIQIPKEDYVIFNIDYYKFIQSNTKIFDLIFVDPPFKFIDDVKLNEIFKLLSKKGILVLRTDKEIKLPADNFGMHLRKEKYGISHVYFFYPRD